METAFDVPIILIFFIRPDSLAQVFERVRAIRPKTLYLVQDGPRNDSDMEKIRQCREIVEAVDWPCDVKKQYADHNLGCGERPYTGISWAFETADRAIILEDDCIPELSFFPYCKELLERYETDTRISYISGLNHFQSWDCGDDSYFFTRTGSIWGWATWKREWALSDYRVRQVQNPYYRRLVRYAFSNQKEAARRMKIWDNVASFRQDRLSYWDIQWGFSKYSQNKLVIVPKHNLISNIGVGAGSTHVGIHYKKPRNRKDFFFIPTQAMPFPLAHPACMLCDVAYDNRVYRHGNPPLPVMLFRRARNVLRRITG